jgi:uncharacterized membrane protein YdjX (TVP38/TMEM64 family)
MSERPDAPAHVAGPDAAPAKVLRKALFLLALALGGILVYRLTPLASWFEPAGAAARWIRDLGPLGALAFALASSVLILAGLPRLLFCPIAGALFGFWGGLSVSIAGSMLSYYVAFLFLHGRADDRPQPVLHPRLAFLQNDPGFVGVVLARLVPMPGMVATVALSLSGVGHRAYLAGSAIGLLPEAAPLVLLGTGTIQSDPTHLVKMVVFALLFGFVVWLLIRQLLRARIAPGDAERPLES